MELSKFLQQDIVEFLDEKATQQREHLNQVREEEMELFSYEKDYAAETQAALEQNNLKKAKHIFDELRDTYNGLDKDSKEREKVYAILQEVYGKIKSHLDEEKHGKSLQEEIDEIEQQGGLQQQEPMKQPETPGAPKTDTEELKKRIEQEKNAFQLAAMKSLRERIHKEEQLKLLIKEIREHVQKKDLIKAVESYRKLKTSFSTYPSDDKFRKVEWYNKVLAVYQEIRDLQQAGHREAEAAAAREKADAQEAERKKTEERQAAQKKLKEEAEKEQKQHETDMRNQHLKSIKQTIKRTINHLDHNELHEAESTLIDARHAVEKLGAAKEKNALETILKHLNSRLQFLKQHQEKLSKKEQEEEKAKHEAEKEAEREKKRKEQEAKDKEAHDDVDKLYQRGLHYQHEGQDEKAKDFYLKILTITPNHLPAQIRLEQLKGGK